MATLNNQRLIFIRYDYIHPFIGGWSSMKIGTLIYLGKEFHSGGMTISQTRGFEHSTYDFFF